MLGNYPGMGEEMNNYPNFPPNYKSVTIHGGLHRTCIVIDILSLNTLSQGELAVIQERVEAAIENIRNHNIEKTDVVLPNRFDPIVKEGLRL